MNKFSEIYENDLWTNGSGPGSHRAACEPLISFLNNFIVDNSIKSIVDIGCGDWQFMSTISLSGIEYNGYDVVASVIQRDMEKYGGGNIKFAVTPSPLSQIPPADLLIIKDVLIHLPNESIFDIVRIFHKFKYVLLVNNTANSSNEYNTDIAEGDFRPIDIGASPFNISSATVMIYGQSRMLDPRMPKVVALLTRKYIWPGEKHVQLVIPNGGSELRTNVQAAASSEPCDS
jgi:hypothetical protein